MMKAVCGKKLMMLRNGGAVNSGKGHGESCLWQETDDVKTWGCSEEREEA